MNKEQIECIVWLMMEYEARRNNLDPLEYAVLFNLRTDWNIERAQSVMLVGSEDEEVRDDK